MTCAAIKAPLLRERTGHASKSQSSGDSNSRDPDKAGDIHLIASVCEKLYDTDILKHSNATVFLKAVSLTHMQEDMRLSSPPSHLGRLLLAVALSGDALNPTHRSQQGLQLSTSFSIMITGQRQLTFSMQHLRGHQQIKQPVSFEALCYLLCRNKASSD